MFWAEGGARKEAWKPTRGHASGKGGAGPLSAACVAYSLQGYAFTGGNKGEVIMWSEGKFKRSETIHSSVVHCLRCAKTEDGEYLFSGGKDGRIVISKADDIDT